MEKFNDEFGDLSGYKILSFEEVSRGFEGNKNPLQGIAVKSFEDRSNEYALKSPFAENSIFYKKIISNIIYNLGIEPRWWYRVENSTKGTELLKNYTQYDKLIDSSKGNYDKETDFIVYIEEYDYINEYIVDIENICLIKMSQAMLKTYFEIIKSDPESKILERWSERIIAQQKLENNIIFSKEKLIEAFRLEIAYRPLKKIAFGNEKHSEKGFTDAILAGFTDAFRQLKFERESWDPTLKSENYLFAIPQDAIATITKKITLGIAILQKVEFSFYALENLMYVDLVMIKTLRSIITFFKKSLQTIENILIQVKADSPYYFAFICGLWDGLVEFFAGFIDIVLLMLRFAVHVNDLDAEDKIIYLKLKEAIIEFAESYFKDPDLLSKALEKELQEYLKNRYSDQQNSYETSHNYGEDLIIAIDIIITIFQIVKAISNASKFIPKVIKAVDNVHVRNPHLVRKLDDIHKPKDLPEQPIVVREIEGVEIKKKKNAKPKEKLKKIKNKRDLKLNEKYQKVIIKRRKIFRKTNRLIKKIELELSETRNIYYRQRAGLEQGKIKNHWYHGALASRIKKVEMSLEDAKIFAEVRQSTGRITNIAKGEIEIWHNGKKVFTKDDYWANASKQNLLKNGIDISPEKYNAKQFLDPIPMKDESGKIQKISIKTRLHDSEVKITSLSDEDIARIATDLNVNPKELVIRYKFYTTYDPCNVCKREILARAVIYPKAQFEVIRPVFRNAEGLIKPVQNDLHFSEFLKQNNLK